MNEDVVFIISVALLLILFAGEPDLMDVIVARMMR